MLAVVQQLQRELGVGPPSTHAAAAPGPKNPNGGPELPPGLRFYIASVTHGCFKEASPQGEGTPPEEVLSWRYRVVHAGLGAVSVGPLEPMWAAGLGSTRHNGNSFASQGSPAGAAAGGPCASPSSGTGTGTCEERGQQYRYKGEEEDRRYMEELAAALPGLNVKPVLDPGALLGELRAKLAANCAINPLTALLGCRNGQLLEQPHTRQLMREVCRELVAVYGAEAFSGVASPGAGVELVAGSSAGQEGALATRGQGGEAEAAAEALYNWVAGVAAATARNKSSMLQDVLACRPTEVDYLVGHVVACAEERGVDAPVHRTLAGLVRARQALYMGAGGGS